MLQLPQNMMDSLMSVKTDLAYQAQASALADEALAWLRRNHSMRAMELGDEAIVRHDFGPHIDQVWFTQPIVGDLFKFGYLVMRPGCPRHAIAAACDFLMEDVLHWVICGVSDHPAGPDDTLAAHVHEWNMVHEATHCIDFQRSGYKPDGFRTVDMHDLCSRYYNRPHESNAYFHQGLYAFLRDMDMVEAKLARFAAQDRNGRRRYFHSALWNGSYWPSEFVSSLNPRNKRKFMRRVFRLLPTVLSGL